MTARSLIDHGRGIATTPGRAFAVGAIVAGPVSNESTMVRENDARRRLRGISDGRHRPGLGLSSVARHSEPSLTIALAHHRWS